MLYTRKDIIERISEINNDTFCDVFTDVPKDFISNIKKEIYKEFSNMSDQLLIEHSRKEQINLRLFAPGLFFISDEILKYSCQNL